MSAWLIETSISQLYISCEGQNTLTQEKVVVEVRTGLHFFIYEVNTVQTLFVQYSATKLPMHSLNFPKTFYLEIIV